MLPQDITALYPLPGRIDWLAPPFLLSILGTLAISVGLFLLAAPAGTAGGLADLPGDPGAQPGLHPGRQPARRGSVQLHGHPGWGDAGGRGLCRLWQSFLGARPGAIGIITVSLGALLGLVLLTWHQCRIWHTSETLWTHALNHGAARSSQAHNNLGLVQFRQGKFVEAAAHCNEAIRLDPGYAESLNNRTMMLAACPEAKYRDGQRAVESATRACELTVWQQPGHLDTLAAAYAEAGDFDAAVAWQTRAIGFLKDETKQDDYRSRLVLYQAKKPYRASPELAPHSSPPVILDTNVASSELAPRIGRLRAIHEFPSLEMGALPRLPPNTIRPWDEGGQVFA